MNAKVSSSVFRPILVVLIAGLSFGAFAAVSDYTRTEKTNYNGKDGITLVTWVKDAGTASAGRAWAIKVDMTKGYRIRTWYGDGNGGKATVGKMAKCLADAGETPIVGINGDYFNATAATAVGQGALISDSQLMWSGNREFGKVGGYASGAYTDTNYYDMQMFFFETADRRLHHDKLVRIDGYTYKEHGNPSNTYDIAYTPDGGQTYQKVRNAIHTCYVNYPVKDGAPYMMGYFQTRNDYPRTLIGLGKTAEGHDMVVFFVNDGRQGSSGWSYGVSDVDSAQMMIDEGCTEVGEFDGGGSASIWTFQGDDSVYPLSATSDPAGGYLNKPSDGAPRSDASGIFIVTANPNEKTVAKIGGYEYPTFREAMFAVAPNETVELVGDDTCAKPLELATPCKISSQKQGGAVVTCSAAASLKAGVCVELENVGIRAPAGLTIPETSVLKVAGNLGSMKVVTQGAAGLVLTDALTGGLTVECANGGDGECFAVSVLPVENLLSSLKHLSHPSDATLVAKAVAGTDGQTQLVWNKRATLGKITGSEGYNHTNEVVSVEVAALAAGSNLKLRLTARDNAGAEVGVIEKDIAAVGTYAYDTAEFGQPLLPGRIYSYTAEVVEAGGEVVTDVEPVSATIPAATEFSWFATQASDGSEVGGKWAEMPTISDGAFVIDPGKAVRFTADVGATNIVRATSTMSFEYGFSAAGAANFLESIRSDPPRGALVVMENEAGDPIWAGLVSDAGVLKLRELEGAAVEWGVTYVCVQELDLSLDVPRVSYLIGAVGAEPVRLRDKDGNCWFEAGGSCAEPVPYAELRGNIRLVSLTGDREDGSVAQVNGVDYGSFAAAANAANGGMVKLYTNVSLDTALLDDGASFKLEKGGFDFKAGGAKNLVYNEDTGLYTVEKVSKGVIFYVK